MADRPPPLRLVSPGGGEATAPAAPPRRELPKNLYYPAPAMKTIWCRYSIGGVLYRRSTGCRDVRNAERRAAAIRAELEAEARGIAPPRRILVTDAIADFRRSLVGGRGGPGQQEKQVRLVEDVLAAKPVRFVDELSQDIYDAWVARARKPTKRCPDGLSTWTVHASAQATRRFGKWLEDSDRVHKSPFRQVPLVSGARDQKRKRATTFEEFEVLLAATRRRQVEDARRTRIHAGLTDAEMVRLRRVGRRRALVLRTIARSGVRPGELRQVTLAHLDLKDGTIFLPAKVAKARRAELAYVTPDLARRLAALVRSMGPGSEDRLLFPKTLPNWRTIDRDIAAAGLPKEDLRRGSLCLYSMRKSFSTHLRMCGVDDDMVGRLMRHAGTSLNSRVYTDAGLLDLREPMRLLDERDRRERRAWRARRREGGAGEGH